MSHRKPRQPRLIPKHLTGEVILIKTGDLDLTTEQGAETCLRRMLAVPMDKTMLLDFLVDYKPGDPHPTEEHTEFHRIQSLLNHHYHGQRFDMMGDSLTAQLFREGLRQVPKFISDLQSRSNPGDPSLNLPMTQ